MILRVTWLGSFGENSTLTNTNILMLSTLATRLTSMWFSQRPSTTRFPFEAFGRAPKRIKIGDTYQFPDAGNMIGTVTSAAVNEVQKKVHFTVTTSAEGT